MKHYCAKLHANLKPRERETLKTIESNNNSDKNTEQNEDDESSTEVDIDNRFNFVRSASDEAPAPNQYVQECRNRSNDSEASKIEIEIVSANWIEH